VGRRRRHRPIDVFAPGTRLFTAAVPATDNDIVLGILYGCSVCLASLTNYTVAQDCQARGSQPIAKV